MEFEFDYGGVLICLRLDLAARTHVCWDLTIGSIVDEYFARSFFKLKKKMILAGLQSWVVFDSDSERSFKRFSDKTFKNICSEHIRTDKHLIT